MLASWMKDTRSTRWSMGIKFVQFSKNRSLHAGIKRSPYKAMFGCDPRSGLESINLPNSVFLQHPEIMEEDEFEKILSSVTSNGPDSNATEFQSQELLGNKSESLSKYQFFIVESFILI